MKSFVALVKREYWEHKGAIFNTPAVIALIFASLMLVGALTGDHLTIEGSDRISFTSFLPEAVDKFENLPEETQEKGISGFLFACTLLFGGIMMVISLFFALGSLYDERKDRSILFWKSLPVSDTETVLSKFVAITLLVPVSYFIVISLFQLYLMIFATVSAWFVGNSGMVFWGSVNLFGVFFDSLMSLVFASLWMAPLWGWFMLASAWAKRVAFLWGTLPILVVTAAEGYLFRSTEFIELVSSRIAHGFTTANANMHFAADNDFFGHSVKGWSQLLTDQAFWIGLLVAAGFLGAAIFTRRFRDES